MNEVRTPAGPHSLGSSEELSCDETLQVGTALKDVTKSPSLQRTQRTYTVPQP